MGGVVVLLLLVASTACAGSGGTDSGAGATVERIVDGDTLVIGGGARVRLVQIDAPEAGGECYAARSTRALTLLAGPGTTVVLEADPALDPVDGFGRLLRYVHVAGHNVNVELVRRGAATPWFYRGERGRYASHLVAAVREARSAGRGLWGACTVEWSPTKPLETRAR